ncbi:MAG: hypothetical protein JST93_27330 [Acidobacteria bacterium]|nr:hypothetical protein [Acidobacteriota bacterium]
MVALGIGFLALSMGGLLMAALFRHSRVAALAVVIILAVEWMLASVGVLGQWARRPPPFMVMMAVLFALTLWLALSQLGGKIVEATPLWVLIASHAFRLPLELVMHQAFIEGLMPIQMSYAGSNLDIVTGATAIVAAALVRAKVLVRAVATMWCVLGLALLFNIVQIAVRSTPVFRAYGDDRLNTWIADVPYVWLPGVLVPVALLGHVLVLRRLRSAI